MGAGDGGWGSGLEGLLQGAWRCKGVLLWNLGPLLGVCAAFALFVVRNGGVVVGEIPYTV